MNEKQFEDALRTWPLAELPAGLPASVLEKIKPRQDNARIVQQSMLKFRLTWMDFALGLFLSLLPVLGFFTLSSLPREFVLYLKYQWLVLQFPAYEPVFFALSGGIAMLLLLTFVLSLRYIFPRQISLF
jgi:hypothetical protein